MSRKFKFHLGQTRITNTLYGNQYNFSIISHSFRLRMRNFSDEFVGKNENMFYNEKRFKPSRL